MVQYAIFVEDELAAAIVRRAIRPLGAAVHALISVAVLPGGAGDIQCKFVPSFAQSSRSSCLVLLDGDQRPERLASALVDVQDCEVLAAIEEVLHGRPQIAVSGSDGSADDQEKLGEYRRILRWVAENVSYLPGLAPESLLLSLTGRTESGASEAKKYWRDFTNDSLGRRKWETVDAREILTHQECQLALVADDHDDLVAIRNRVMQLISTAGDGKW